MKATDCWDPFREWAEQDGRCDGRASGEGGAAWMPRADFAASDDDYYLILDLPGITESNLKVVVQNDRIRVSAVRCEAAPPGVVYRYQKNERLQGEFCREFLIPKDGVKDQITVDYHNGVLYIRIPRSAEGKPRKIDISGN